MSHLSQTSSTFEETCIRKRTLKTHHPLTSTHKMMQTLKTAFSAHERRRLKEIELMMRLCGERNSPLAPTLGSVLSRHLYEYNLETRRAPHSGETLASVAGVPSILTRGERESRARTHLDRQTGLDLGDQRHAGRCLLLVILLRCEHRGLRPVRGKAQSADVLHVADLHHVLVHRGPR